MLLIQELLLVVDDGLGGLVQDQVQITVEPGYLAPMIIITSPSPLNNSIYTHGIEIELSFECTGSVNFIQFWYMLDRDEDWT